MNIIILGAGQVGASLAESLIEENHSITIVDTNEERLTYLSQRYDLRTVQGNCSYPSTLLKCNAEDADMILAVTNNDEANIVALDVAHAWFETPTKIARIRAQDYIMHEELFNKSVWSIDFLINPEKLVTNQIINVIESPNTLQVINLFNDVIQLLVIKMTTKNILLKTIADININFPKDNIFCLAIFRNKNWIETSPSTEFEIGDELYFLVPNGNQKILLKLFGFQERTNNLIMIAGGGNIGYYLAKILEHDFSIKIIEQNKYRCDYLSHQLEKSIVFYGNACDPKLLAEENIEQVDVFCSLTNDDEDNIISCLQASLLGVKQTLAVITRAAYVQLIENGVIHINNVISPQLSTADSILEYLRRDNLIKVHSIFRGTAKLMEITIKKEFKNKDLLSKPLGKLKLPKGAVIGTILRNNSFLQPNAEFYLNDKDRFIIFIPNKSLMTEIETLFQ